MTLDDIFKQVISWTTKENKIVKTTFGLRSPQRGFGRTNHVIGKKEQRLFEEMKKDFEERVEWGMEHGFSKFHVLMEGETDVAEEQEVAVKVSKKGIVI